MARLFVEIPDEVDERMRRLIPAKKGAISQWVTEAILDKIEKEEKSLQQEDRASTEVITASELKK